MRMLRPVLLALLLAMPLSAHAASIAERSVLPNGMVLLHSQRSNLPIVTVIVAVRAGSLQEPADKAGLGNLTASLLNQGTKSRSAREISEAIEFVGGSLSSSGGQEYMTVGLTVLKKDLPLGLELLADVLMNPAFSEAEMQRKVKSIRGSIIRQKEEPGVIASKSFQEAVFGNHPYGRPVEGTEDSLDRIRREDVLQYYETFYLPNNALMAVVGDVSREELQRELEKHLLKWKTGELPALALPELRPRSGPELITKDRKLTQANIILGHLGIKRGNPDFYAVTVMNYILGGGGFASRMMDNIRDNRGLAYDVHSAFSVGKYGGSFAASLQTKNESANTAIEEVLREMERMRSEPVADKELQDAKSYLTGSFPLRMDSNRKIAGLLVAIEYSDLGLEYVDEYPRLINAVTKDDIMRVARKYLDPKNYVLVVVADIGRAAPRRYYPLQKEE